MLSNFCPECINALPSSSDLHEEWKEKHAKTCLKNFDGSANAMEVECAKRIWERSIEKHGLRYTTMLSDGDSKSFTAISKEKVYGESVTIEKEECVSHVSKRMGTALNNLKSESKAQKQSIGGKGKLTQEKIIRIQNYYGRAIKDNAEDTKTMKKKDLCHFVSSDF